MDHLVQTVHDVAQSSNEGERKKLIDTLHRLAMSLEEPQELMQRLLYQHIYITIARIGCDLKIFNHIADSKDPVTTVQLAKQVSAAPRLLSRLLRYLASVGALREVGPDTYLPNKTTEALANPLWQSGIYHNFDTMLPHFRALPDFLKSTHYADIDDPANCPFTSAFDTKEPVFAWLPKDEWRFHHFNQFMVVQREGMPTWLTKYAYLDKAKALAPEQALFIDIGGGLGHQSNALRDALPEDIKGKIVVQDQEAMLSLAVAKDGVDHEAYDFFGPQPIKNAKMYYMRNIMHDWPDHKAVKILQNQKSAMGPDSVLLIDDMVLPNEGANWHATQLDMAMMSGLAAEERSLAQWEKLIDSTGLKIKDIHQYTTSLGDSIIECTL